MSKIHTLASYILYGHRSPALIGQSVDGTTLATWIALTLAGFSANEFNQMGHSRLG